MEEDKKYEKIDLTDAFNKDSSTKPRSLKENQLPTQSLSPGTPKIVRWLIKLFGGRINEFQANLILIVFSILAIIISLFLFFGGNNNQRNQGPIDYSAEAEEAGSEADITP